MIAGYKLLFWGIILASISLSVGSIMIIPTFIGFIIAHFGLQDLEATDQTGDYSIPKTGMGLLIVLTFIKSAMGLIFGIDFGEVPGLIFFPAILIVIELITFHKILESAIEYFDTTKMQYKAPLIVRKDRVYIIMMGIALVVLIISSALNMELTIILGTIIGLLARIYFLTILHMLKNEVELLEHPEV